MAKPPISSETVSEHRARIASELWRADALRFIRRALSQKIRGKKGTEDVFQSALLSFIDRPESSHDDNAERKMFWGYLRKKCQEAVRAWHHTEKRSVEREKTPANYDPVGENSVCESEPSNEEVLDQIRKKVGEEVFDLVSLKVLGDLTFTELGKSLGIPRSTAELQYQRARKKMLAAYKDSLDD